MLENFLWKGSAIVFIGTFEAFILELKCHEIYFAENLLVATSDVSCFYFSFLFEFCK